MPARSELEGDEAGSGALTRWLTIGATLLAFAALMGVTRLAPGPLLAHIVTLDAKRLALSYVDELADGFDLPGKRADVTAWEAWSAEALLGPVREAGSKHFDLFDTARFNSDATSQSIRGYTVFNRFGDRLLSAGQPLVRRTDGGVGASRFGAAHEGGVAAYRSGRMDETTGVVISVVVPLAHPTRGFNGAIMIDVERNGIEPGILAGIERSIFALVALVLTIAFVLLVLMTLLRAHSVRMRNRAAYLAQFDPLTGLMNREAFNRALSAKVRAARERKRHFALVQFDLHRFGRVNEMFGEPVGDAALAAFAERLNDMLRHDPTFAQCGARAARLGGDEFAAFFACDARDQLERVCDALASLSERDVRIGPVRLEMRAAIGAALHPFDGDTADALQASVRYALDVAREALPQGDHPACARVFDTEIAARHRRRRKLLHDIEGAVARGEFQVHYQPQVEVGDRSRQHPRLVGFEALLRWQHPQEGAVSPAEFIPLAEQSGLIRTIGAWCLEEACREAAGWPNPDAPTIAVNVSSAQFVDDVADHPGLVAQVATVLSQTGLAPERLELEITEGLLLGDNANIDAILSGLEGLGVRLALDDFGTGYSSLSYLSRIPVGKVKLDRSFVLQLQHDERVRAIVRAVATMCAEMGMGVLAEGVESKAEQDLLLSLGCRHVQGYLHGRPTRDAVAVIERYRARSVARQPVAQKAA